MSAQIFMPKLGFSMEEGTLVEWLVADGAAMSAHYEQLLRRMNREGPAESKRVLELNGEHPAILALRALFEKNPGDPRIETHGRLLYEQAVIAEGSKLKDPAAFAKRINELLAKDLGNG